MYHHPSLQRDGAVTPSLRVSTWVHMLNRKGSTGWHTHTHNSVRPRHISRPSHFNLLQNCVPETFRFVVETHFGRLGPDSPPLCIANHHFAIAPHSRADITQRIITSSFFQFRGSYLSSNWLRRSAHNGQDNMPAATHLQPVHTTPNFCS
jgi:hypothetical protein